MDFFTMSVHPSAFLGYYDSYGHRGHGSLRDPFFVKALLSN